jgi:EAL domain-containing protein (putative c-di-GMP-specific phosphodiesterase class I)
LGVSSDSSIPSRSRPRILVADDEAPLLRAITRILEAAGYEVSAAEDGIRAVQLLAEETFDAVLTDVAMPGMSGLALLRAVRERDLHVPVLLMTGAPGVESASEAVHYGASEYLIKPVPIWQLEKTIRKAIDLSLLAEAKRDAMRMLETGRPEAGDLAGLEVTLNRALDSLWMAYQPIVNAGTGALFGYEALLRSTELALPHPGAVLDAAERLGRLDDVGRTVRSIAPEPMQSAPSPALLFLNLHASDLNDESLVSPSAPLTSIAHRVVLEVTERESLEKIDDVRSTVARLREMGFRIAIDDLGAGYAGLTSFAQLEPEFVKLDMSLVRDAHKSQIKQKLVGSMTALCKEMGITVVAEGVELAEERDAVVGLGCDLLQGFLFARPGKAFPEVRW